MNKILILLLLIQISIFSENLKEEKKNYSFGILFGNGKIINPKELEDSINNNNFNSPEYNAYFYQNTNNESRRGFELTRLVSPNSAGFNSQSPKIFFEFLMDKNTSLGFSIEDYNLYIKNYLNYNFTPPQYSTIPSRNSVYPYEVFYYGIQEGKLIRSKVFSIEFNYYFDFLKTKYLSPYIKLYGLPLKRSNLINYGTSIGTKIHITEDYSFIIEGYYDEIKRETSSMNIARLSDAAKILFRNYYQELPEAYIVFKNYGYRIGIAKKF